MKLYNPFSLLTKLEWLLWVGSLLLIAAAFLLCGSFSVLVLAACLLGATALIFVSKGDPFGQLLTVFFGVVYAYISFEFHYWGEMITYLGMTAPIAVLSLISWIRHPYEEGKSEVRVSHSLGGKQKALLFLLTAAVAVVFYWILRFFDTPNLAVSTLSIATSFLAASLTFLRRPTYALAYAANDVVLMVLWILATLTDPSYFPMIVCFLIFLVNDCYGFFNWRRIRKRQSKTDAQMK